MLFLEFLSIAFGWIYTLCWSLSFYPQTLLNYRRRSTSGTTVDFPLINCLGFFAYFVSNCAFRYSPVIRAQYAARYHGLTPTVQVNDVAFAGHAFVVSSITTSQYFPRLWGFARAAGQRPSRFILGIMGGCVAGPLVVVLVVVSRGGGGGSGRTDLVDPATDWCWLDAVYAVSYVKLLITLIKYAPQLITNFRNRSTRGWSIGQILLDFSGGLLSLAQLAIDSYLQHDWSGVIGNPVKFALGNVSMLYDLVFFTQHYVLYRGEEGKAHEEDALIGSSSGDDEEEQRERRYT